MMLDERNGDFNEIIQNCMTHVSAQADNAGVALVNHAASELPELYMDDRKLRQVLINLLSNAIKFTPEGGQIGVHACMTGDNSLRVTVTDTGIGIAPEDIPRVLQKFGQVDNSLQRKFDGVGLGLPLSKSLIELHGGSLWIESSPGKGAAVSFTLPASRFIQPRLLHAVST